MINKSQKKKLIKVLGKYYVESVLQVCKDKGAVNKNGDTHSISSIVNTMNGRPNSALEALIYEAFAIKKAEQVSETKRREELLKTKKTEAATSVSK